ncbi:type 1 glutamine amidotransferase domain-containing protein [Corynebacterium riegelii]|uniref:type 1 glutamine amidotransferase domain-containing protein n=1 Tax=Corynebacterium riegelii TaxID=156976 RepID=UPI00191FC62D|nr:type 1 glutamine amidotransferase domain-containing protein [Corynebacterium riegelii]QQU84322.1 type 1 glutamine amidotransferase [Corynebacterium riegelii]
MADLNNALNNKTIAILSTDGFEDSELTSPKEAVEAAGATTRVVSTESGEIEGKNGTKVAVELLTSDANVNDFDALILPGGTINADHIRVDEDAVALVKAFKDAGKPIGVICHGGWILTDADVIRGVKLTSVKNVKTDLINAGADWVDEEVVVDSGVISSRTPDDLPAFNAALVEEFAK